MVSPSPYRAHRNSVNYYTIVLVFLALQGLAQPAAAEEILALSGIEGTSKRVYGYVGAITPFPGGGKLTDDGLRLRFWVDGQSFNYDRTPLAKVDAQGEGVEGAVGYQVIRPQYYASAYVGVRYQHFDLSPDDQTTKVKGGHVGMRLQLEDTYNFNTHWGVSVVGSYLAFLNDFWTRIRPFYMINQNISVGPEFVAFGGTLYDRQVYGVFIDGIPLGKVSLGLKAGSEYDIRRRESVPSFGANIGIHF